MLIYRDSTGQIVPLVSGENDQITKDNTDPMPFVRWEHLLSDQLEKIFIQNHLGPQQSLYRSSMEDIERRKEGKGVYSGAELSRRGLSGTSVRKHPRVMSPLTSHPTSLDNFIFSHLLTVTCDQPDSQWQISFLYSYKVGASYNIFVTEEEVSVSPASYIISTSTSIPI